MVISESYTRKKIIDKLLKQAGWSSIRKYSKELNLKHGAICEYPTLNGPADYLLIDKGKPIAIVEAKKLSNNPRSALDQAKRYARGLDDSPYSFNDYKVPFIYSTNGKRIFFQDIRDRYNLPRQVSQFHSPLALWNIFDKNESNSLTWLKSESKTGYGLRPYQIEAIDAIEEAIINGKRQMMVAMATGTGKTRVAVTEVYRLLKSGYAKKILFLVDRRTLAAQAVGSFSVFEPEPALKFNSIYEVYTQKFRTKELKGDVKWDLKSIPESYLSKPDPNHAFVFVCTVQLMQILLFGQNPDQNSLTGDEEKEVDASKIHIPIDAFDVIIADECHRGYTSKEQSKWREVIEYFDAIKIGLTATPAPHTKAFFKEIVYRYGIDRAIREGWLVDYDIIEIKSKIRSDGMFLKPGENVGLIDVYTGEKEYDVLEDERAFDSSSLEKDVTSIDSNEKILDEVVEHLLNQEKELGRFPKTLIFAVNDLKNVSHCDRIVDILSRKLNRGDDFVKKITSGETVDNPLGLFRKFRNRKEPAIAVTVYYLSTGVDIPQLENIVFLKPVKSRILFEQMLGRGTRRCEDISKTHFSIYDAVSVLDYFRNASDFVSAPPEKTYRKTRKVIEDLYGNKDVEYNLKVLIKRLHRIDKNITTDGREAFSKFVENGDIGKFASELSTIYHSNRGALFEILNNKEFLYLLENYPRSKIFVEALDQEDIVTSDQYFHSQDGRVLKPSEYLAEFEAYIKTNPDQIEAIEILLNRPEHFDTSTLNELREKLSQNVFKFTEENLRKAYQVELSDIITIIHHAIDAERPINTAEDRVNYAMNRLYQKHDFSEDQKEWLKLIQLHLVENLILDQSDFNMIPFSRKGGWVIANKVFQGNLPILIAEVNRVMLE